MLSLSKHQHRAKSSTSSNLTILNDSFYMQIKRNYTAIGIAIGVALGIAMRKLALGIAIGLAIGFLLNLLQNRKNK